MLKGIRLKEKTKRLVKPVAAIAHSHRLAILYLLCHEAERVRDLQEELKLPENLVSHHLKIMAKEGLLRKERIGKNVFYHLNEKTIKDLKKVWKEFLGDAPEMRQIFTKPS